MNKTTVSWVKVSLAVILLMAGNASAANAILNTDGSAWSNSVWTGITGYPGSSDIAYIRNGYEVTVNSDVGSVTRFHIGDAAVSGTINIVADGSLTSTTASDTLRSDLGRGTKDGSAGYMNISGGTLKMGNTGGNVLNIGLDAASAHSTGILTISAGAFNGRLLVGSSEAGDSGDQVTITGASAIIGTASTIGNALEVRASGTLEFKFDAVGISTMDYGTSGSGGVATFAAGSQIVIDGSAYTGGAAAFNLITAGTLGAENATVSLINFAEGTTYDWNNTTDVLSVHVVPNPADAPKQVSDMLGVVHVSGKYFFTTNDFLNEGADEIEALGTSVIKLWLNRYPMNNYVWNSDWSQYSFNNMVDLIQTPYYQNVINRAQFKTVVLMASEFRVGEYASINWQDTVSTNEYLNCQQDFYNLTEYLLTNYAGSGKTFILQNWEGDNALNFDAVTNAADRMNRVDGMIDWLNARQAGIDQARNDVGMASDVQVFGVAEVNQIPVYKTFDWPLAIDAVIPNLHMDLYSYSDWSTKSKGTEYQLTGILDYIKEKAPPSDCFGEDNIYLGEFGCYEMLCLGDWVDAHTDETDRVHREVVGKQLELAFKWGVKYALYWQVYGKGLRDGASPSGEADESELHGVWLRRPDGSYTGACKYFENILSKNLEDYASIYEVENQIVAVSAGDSQAQLESSDLSGGYGSELAADGTNDYIQYTLAVPSSGTYTVTARCKSSSASGTFQSSIEGYAFGSPVDCYAEVSGYSTVELGTVNITTAGNKKFRFTVTGKNALSSDYDLAFDYLDLTLNATTNGGSLSLPNIFAEHMVLQRGEPVAVWGTCESNASVQVELLLVDSNAVETVVSSVTVSSGTNETWEASLPATVATPKGAHHVLVVTSEGEEILLDPVYVGDVWLCSGQSNMNFIMKPNPPWSPGVINWSNEVALAGDAMLNVFTVVPEANPVPLDNVSGSWRPDTPTCAEWFSAVGYLFGRELRTDLDVPVGIVVAALGATSISSWLNLSAQENIDHAQSLIALHETRLATYTNEIATYYQNIPEYRSEAVRKQLLPFYAEPYSPYEPENYPTWRYQPGGLYNGMLAPLERFPVKGVVWYQGESDSTQSATYFEFLSSLIQSWRALRSRTELPFLVVQLPNFDTVEANGSDPAVYDNTWAGLRKAQAQALSISNVAVVVTADSGDSLNIHCPDKQTVAARLRLAALNMVYGQTSLVASGPAVETLNVQEDEMVVSFSDIGSGLTIDTNRATGDGPDFEVAGTSRTFYPADYRINGDSVVLRAAEVPVPVHVRYAYHNDPTLVLYNAEGLPAMPFRLSPSMQELGSFTFDQEDQTPSEIHGKLRELEFILGPGIPPVDVIYSDTSGNPPPSFGIRCEATPTNEASAIAAGSYVEIRAQTYNGYYLIPSLLNFSFKIARNTTLGDFGYAVRSSADGFSASLVAEQLPSQHETFFPVEASLPESAVTPVQEIRYRIYLWDSQDTRSYAFRLDGISMTGRFLFRPDVQIEGGASATIRWQAVPEQGYVVYRSETLMTPLDGWVPETVWTSSGSTEGAWAYSNEWTSGFFYIREVFE